MGFTPEGHRVREEKRKGGKRGGGAVDRVRERARERERERQRQRQRQRQREKEKQKGRKI